MLPPLSPEMLFHSKAHLIWLPSARGHRMRNHLMFKTISISGQQIDTPPAVIFVILGYTIPGLYIRIVLPLGNHIWISFNRYTVI